VVTVDVRREQLCAKIVSEFALHVRCPFRIAGNRRVLLGSEDLRWVQEGPSIDDGPSVFDEQLARIDSVLVERKPLVVSAAVSMFGDIDLRIDSGLIVAVFPASARDAESWRFFRRGDQHLTFP
jgi:hypothetical protein